MQNLPDLLTSVQANHANYQHEERPMQSVRKIIVKGAVDVIFRRFGTPHLVVAGETQAAIDSVKTSFNGDKLVIESTGNISVNGDVHVSGSFFGININGRGFSVGGGSVNHGRLIVGVALPEIEAVKIKGSGDVTLLDLQQHLLELQIEGSGDIDASGTVEELKVSIAGSGDVDASGLTANRASLSIAGSGDIDALVRQSVRASVAGSGDILVRGNPTSREKSVAGSGSVKFK